MKKRVFLCLTTMLAILLMNPLNTSAKEENIIKCTYEFKGENLQFITSKDNVKLPIQNGKLLSGKKVYYGEDFEESYLKSSENNICPNITIEENDSNITIFVNSRNEELCNGNCYQLMADKGNPSVETKTSNAIGEYKKTSYFIPQFRKLKDETIEWTINNKDFYKINQSITLKDGSIVKVSEKLAKNIFTNNEKTIKIYRCISDENGKVIYTLESDSKSCSADLSKNDNQGEKSLSFNGASGANECQSTLLGSPTDEKSVAWLVQHLLNYLKVLGPMIIIVLSGVDFIKAMISGDDESLQKSYKKLMQRLILALVLFSVPTLVTFLLNLFGFMGDPLCGIE